jgi:hypothetical protein
MYLLNNFKTRIGGCEALKTKEKWGKELNISFAVILLIINLISFCQIAFADYHSLHCSAFHLSYNMILNQMRCEDGDPENLLRNSFYQFQADRAIPSFEVS